jgi:hypothetical protein
MRLCHPPDGSTNPKYKLLCFITTKKNFCKEKNALAFNQDRCCHLVLCLQLIPFHCTQPSPKVRCFPLAPHPLVHWEISNHSVSCNYKMIFKNDQLKGNLFWNWDDSKRPSLLCCWRGSFKLVSSCVTVLITKLSRFSATRQVTLVLPTNASNVTKIELNFFYYYDGQNWVW